PTPGAKIEKDLLAQILPIEWSLGSGDPKKVAFARDDGSIRTTAQYGRQVIKDDRSLKTTGY
ncbi:MAG TPA: hypothetical protein VKV05_03530, partial [Terriglobales bacterium]|nr:hypothetical protein [Terriglobales bacterium]